MTPDAERLNMTVLDTNGLRIMRNGAWVFESPWYDLAILPEAKAKLPTCESLVNNGTLRLEAMARGKFRAMCDAEVDVWLTEDEKLPTAKEILAKHSGLRWKPKNKARVEWKKGKLERRLVEVLTGETTTYQKYIMERFGPGVFNLPAWVVAAYNEKQLALDNFLEVQK